MKNIIKKILLSIFLIISLSAIHAMQDQDINSNQFEERYLLSNFKEILYLDFFNLIKKEKFNLIIEVFDDYDDNDNTRAEKSENDAIKYISIIFENAFNQIFSKNENLFLSDFSASDQKETKAHYFAIKIREITKNILQIDEKFLCKIKNCVLRNLNKFVTSKTEKIISNLAQTTGNLIYTTYNLPENIRTKFQRIRNLKENTIYELQQRAYEIMLNGLAARLKNCLARLVANDIKYNDPLDKNSLYKFLNNKDVNKDIEMKMLEILRNYFSEKNNIDFVLYQRDPKSPECLEFRKRANSEKSFAKEIYSDLLNLITQEHSLNFFLSFKKNLVIPNFMTIFNDQLRNLEKTPINWRKRVLVTGKWLVKFGPLVSLGIKKYPRVIWDIFKNKDYFHGFLLGGIITAGEFALHKLWTKGICSWIFRDKNKN
ncbi:MAG: hypothetical protein WC436_01200 [Candidatus Babeliales bacterium]